MDSSWLMSMIMPKKSIYCLAWTLETHIALYNIIVILTEQDECTEIRRAMNIATMTMSEPVIDQSIVGQFLTTNSIIMSSIIFLGFFFGALFRKLLEEYD